MTEKITTETNISPKLKELEERSQRIYDLLAEEEGLIEAGNGDVGKVNELREKRKLDPIFTGVIQGFENVLAGNEEGLQATRVDVLLFDAAQRHGLMNEVVDNEQRGAMQELIIKFAGGEQAYIDLIYQGVSGDGQWNGTEVTSSVAGLVDAVVGAWAFDIKKEQGMGKVKDRADVEEKRRDAQSEAVWNSERLTEPARNRLDGLAAALVDYDFNGLKASPAELRALMETLPKMKERFDFSSGQVEISKLLGEITIGGNKIAEIPSLSDFIKNVLSQIKRAPNENNENAQWAKIQENSELFANFPDVLAWRVRVIGEQRNKQAEARKYFNELRLTAEPGGDSSRLVITEQLQAKIAEAMELGVVVSLPVLEAETGDVNMPKIRVKVADDGTITGMEINLLAMTSLPSDKQKNMLGFLPHLNIAELPENWQFQQEGEGPVELSFRGKKIATLSLVEEGWVGVDWIEEITSQGKNNVGVMATMVASRALSGFLLHPNGEIGNLRLEIGKGEIAEPVADTQLEAALSTEPEPETEPETEELPAEVAVEANSDSDVPDWLKDLDPKTTGEEPKPTGRTGPLVQLASELPVTAEPIDAPDWLKNEVVGEDEKEAQQVTLHRLFYEVAVGDELNENPLVLNKEQIEAYKAELIAYFGFGRDPGEGNNRKDKGFGQYYNSLSQFLKETGLSILKEKYSNDDGPVIYRSDLDGWSMPRELQSSWRAKSKDLTALVLQMKVNEGGQGERNGSMEMTIVVLKSFADEIMKSIKNNGAQRFFELYVAASGELYDRDNKGLQVYTGDAVKIGEF